MAIKQHYKTKSSWFRRCNIIRKIQVESFLLLVYNNITMYIEDLINRLASDGVYLFNPDLALSRFDHPIVHSLSQQILQGKGFTEKQGTLAIRIVKKYVNQLNTDLKMDVTPILADQRFKFPFRVIDFLKTVTVKKHIEINKKIISVSFPYDNQLVDKIKIYRRNSSKSTTVNWNADSRSWDFDFVEDHVDWINNNFIDSSFVIDDEFANIAEQIELIKNSLEDHVPMITFENNRFVYKNVPNSVIQPAEDEDVVSVVATGKKYGITTWCEYVDNSLNKLQLDPALHGFLTNSLKSDNLSLKQIFSIVNFSLPWLVIISGGSELKQIKLCHTMLEQNGISANEMSTLFRLSNENGNEFNNYVKENKLNGSVSKNTKIVFISGKVPKPLIEADIDFSCILSFGILGVHYTLSNYLKNHHFVLNYALKESDFAGM